MIEMKRENKKLIRNLLWMGILYLFAFVGLYFGCFLDSITSPNSISAFLVTNPFLIFEASILITNFIVFRIRMKEDVMSLV